MINKIIGDVKLLTCSSSANMRLSISISLISDCVSTKLAWSSFCRVLEFNRWCYILHVFCWRFLIEIRFVIDPRRLKECHLDTSSWLLYLSSNSSSLLKRSLLCSCNRISLFAIISEYYVSRQISNILICILAVPRSSCPSPPSSSPSLSPTSSSAGELVKRDTTRRRKIYNYTIDGHHYRFVLVLYSQWSTLRSGST